MDALEIEPRTRRLKASCAASALVELCNLPVRNRPKSGSAAFRMSCRSAMRPNIGH